MADAQGAILLLQRVRDLSSRGYLDFACDARALKVTTFLTEFCEKKLGDMSLVGFDARQRLDEIEKGHAKRQAEMRAAGGVLGTSVKARAVKAFVPRNGPLVELSHGDLVRMHVPGLEGMNSACWIADDGKLKVLLR